MLNLYFGIALMLLLCFVEILFIKFREKKEVPWREIIFNLNSGHVVLWLFRGVEVFLFDVVSRHLNLGWISLLPVWAQWVFAFFAWDFCFYWMHRLHHKYRILWAVHAVHHEGEHFNCSLGIRNSWYSSLTSFPFFAGLAVIGVSTEQFYIMGAVHYFIQFYNHNDVIKHHGIIDHVIVSPSHHKIHHASNIEYRDKNCGGTLTLWDKLFGTYQKEQEGVVMQLGLPSSKHAIDHPITANNFHFAKMMKLQQWFLRPKEKHPISKREEFVISIGGFLLFCLLIFYIYQEDKWSKDNLTILFGLLAVATIALYGMFENMSWGRGLWLVFGFLLLFFATFIIHWNDFLVLISLVFIVIGVFIMISHSKLGWVILLVFMPSIGPIVDFGHIVKFGYSPIEISDVIFYLYSIEFWVFVVYGYLFLHTVVEMKLKESIRKNLFQFLCLIIGQVVFFVLSYYLLFV